MQTPVTVRKSSKLIDPMGHARAQMPQSVQASVVFGLALRKLAGLPSACSGRY